MVLLDTSFLVDLLRGKDAALDKMHQMRQQGVSFGTTAITAMELFHGALRSSRKQEDMAEVNRLLQRMLVLEFDDEIAVVAAALLFDLERHGTVIGIADTLIAASAIFTDEPLLTKDRHFQRIPDIKVELLTDWLFCPTCLYWSKEVFIKPRDSTGWG